MPSIKDMNLVEILILSQSETKGKFNAFPHKGESEGSVHQTCFIKCSAQEERNGKTQKPAAFLRWSGKGGPAPAPQLAGTRAVAIKGTRDRRQRGGCLNVVGIISSVFLPCQSHVQSSLNPIRCLSGGGRTRPWGVTMGSRLAGLSWVSLSYGDLSNFPNRGMDTDTSMDSSRPPLPSR